MQRVINHFRDEAVGPNGGRPLGVVNLSLGVRTTDTTWQYAIKELVNIGLVVVVSAGNDDKDACMYSPAQFPDAITVGATNMDDSKAC